MTLTPRLRITSIVALAAMASLAIVNARAADEGVEAVSWLAGCWQGSFGEPGTIEHWLAPAGGTMLGMSRTVKQGRTVEFEFMQLRRLPEGPLAFVAQPAGRAPTVFRAVTVSATEAAFENLELDFPQRITYARPEAGRLVASLAGVRNGAPRRIEFAFERVACDAASGVAGR